MAQTRTIENRGILQLTPLERSGKSQRLFSEVIQLPYSEYLNVKSNPPHGFYGYAVLMAKEYAVKKIPIEFIKQYLHLEERFDGQVGEQVVCNAMSLLRALVIISYKIPGAINVEYVQPDLVEYPLWEVTTVKFVLVPGCIIKVEYAHENYQKCPASPVVQPDLLPPPSSPAPPASPPPANAPDEDKIPLSSPYEGQDDNGDTFVRDIPEEPPIEPGSPGPDCTKTYRVTFTINYTNKDGSSGTDGGVTNVQGEIVGFETFYNPAFDSYAYRAIRKDCGGTVIPTNLYGTTGVSALSGSATVTEIP